VLEQVGLRPHPLAGEPAEQLALLERIRVAANAR